MPKFFAKQGAILSATVLVVLAVASILLVGFALAPRAQGQEVSCERVPYNERIILRCDTNVGDAFSGGRNDPTPTPTPDATNADKADADSNATNDDAELDRGRSSVDRGDRGSRVGIEQVDDLSSDDADDEGATRNAVDDETDVDGERTSSDGEATNTSNDTAEADEPDDDNADESTGDESTSDDENGEGDAADETAVQFDFSPDPPDNNAPLMAAAGGIAGLGAVLYLAAKRHRRSGSEETA